MKTEYISNQSAKCIDQTLKYQRANYFGCESDCLEYSIGVASKHATRHIVEITIITLAYTFNIIVESSMEENIRRSCIPQKFSIHLENYFGTKNL